MDLTRCLRCTPALSADAASELRQDMIFDCCKWDPQAGDVSVLAPFALILTPTCWRELAAAAEALYRETLRAEAEIAARSDLISRLKLPAALARALRPRDPPRVSTDALRIMRFDFHPAREGWRVSEVNSDVPGGYIESSGFARLMAARFPETAVAADPVEVLADSLRRRHKNSDTLGLVHATAYLDDRQVMIFLQRQLSRRGMSSQLLSPADITWRETGAFAGDTPLSALLRFFPVEWLPNLPGSTWKNFFRPAPIPQINPGQAAISQSKRFPLTWPQLQEPLARWKELSPETREWSESLADSPEWVCKPSFGRVGDGLGLHGATEPREWRDIVRARRQRPPEWIAQRRFNSLPLETPAGPRHVCLGLYVIDGQAAGIYGRIAARPLIDHLAQDVAVLVDTSATANTPPLSP